MRLYSHFDTFELYNTRRWFGKFFFGFFVERLYGSFYIIGWRLDLSEYKFQSFFFGI